jgi:fimbrial chaperone protein
MRTQWLLLGWLVTLPVPPVAASTFNIAPIRADLSPGHRTEALTLTNVDDDPVVVQVRVVAWSQRNGEEQLDDTRELLATPPVLQIPAKGEQIIRVALRREADPVKELTYRVIFEEIPQAAPVEFTGLRVALRLSVPVFVAPSHGRAVPDVTWDAHLLPDGGFEIAATNHGTAHLQISDFDVQWQGTQDSLHGMTSKYVLPNSRMAWKLNPSGEPVRGPLVIHGRSDQGEFSADVAQTGL